MNLPPWARDLFDAPVARLATASTEGRPAIIPVCFVVVDDTAWSVIDEKPKSGKPLTRLRNIAENPQVSLLLDRYSDDWSQLAWVVLHGSADTPAAESRPDILELLRAKYPQYREMALERSTLIRIAVTTAVSWRAAGS